MNSTPMQCANACMDKPISYEEMSINAEKNYQGQLTENIELMQVNSELIEEIENLETVILTMTKIFYGN